MTPKTKTPPPPAPKNKRILKWLAYIGVIAAYVFIYQWTEPEADYMPNVKFQMVVAAGVGFFLIRAIVELTRDFDLGQVFKVLFWSGALVYTLGDVLFFLRKLNRFTHFAELLVAFYIIAVILKEKRPGTSGRAPASSRPKSS